MAAVRSQQGLSLKQGLAPASGPQEWGNGGLRSVALPSKPVAARRALSSGAGKSSAARRSSP